MAQLIIDTNKGTADSLKSGATKINNNFTELYSILATDQISIPSLLDNSGKYLTTDGTTVSWGTVAGGAGGTVPNAVLTTGNYANPSWITSLAGSKITGTIVATNGVVTTTTYVDPSWISSLSGLKLSGTITATNGVVTNASYANPEWITSLAGTKVINAVLTTGNYADPSWIGSLAGSKITGTIVATNGVVTTATYADPSWITSLAGSKITGTIVATNGVVTTATYADPSWITSLAGSKITGTIVATNGVVTTTTYSDPSWLTLSKSKVGLENVDNTTDANKPVSTATQTALDLKAPIASPTFTGTVTLGAVGNVSITGGSSGQILTTNGLGVLSWGTVSGLVGLSTRTTVTTTTASLANNANANANITGYKSYVLLKIQTSAAAWVRIYSDDASRTADASRTSNTDPAPGAGIIAEVITTSAQTILISPGSYGFNNESTPTTTIPINITNLSGSAAAITVTLTVLQLEA